MELGLPGGAWEIFGLFIVSVMIGAKIVGRMDATSAKVSSSYNMADAKHVPQDQDSTKIPNSFALYACKIAQAAP